MDGPSIPYWIFIAIFLSNFILVIDAFPWGPYVITRAGRGSPSKYWTEGCCPIGLKAELYTDEMDMEKRFEYCQNQCCDLLEEETYLQPDGTQYTYCKHKDPKLNAVLEDEIARLSREGINRLAKLLSQDSLNSDSNR